MKHVWKKLSLCISLILLVLVASGCGTGEKAQPNSSGQGKAETGSGTINIGWSGPLSGGAALYGKNCLTGLELAAKEINDAGGLEVKGTKYKINLVSLDDRYLPNETATNARRLLMESKAKVIYTPHSGGVFALQEFNQQEGFLLAAYTSEPKVMERGNKLMMRIPPKYSGYVEPFSKAVMERFGKKAALVPGTHAYAKNWSEVFIKGWTQLGGQITSNNPVDYNKDTEFYTPVSKALATKPDVLFIGGASEPTAMVIKQARELGFKGGFVIMDQAKMEEIEKIVGKETLEGAVGVIPVAQVDAPGTKPFIESYNKQYGKAPTWEQAWHYTSLHIIAEAMQLAGTVEDPVAIHAKLGEAIKNLPPEKLTMPLKGIDEKGGLYGGAIGAIMTKGEYQRVEIPQ